MAFPSIDNRDRDSWHFKKEIQLGHLLTTITVAISAVIYITKVEQRVAVIETQLVAQRDSSALLRAQLDNSSMLLRTQLDKVNDKLDRLIERREK